MKKNSLQFQHEERLKGDKKIVPDIYEIFRELQEQKREIIELFIKTFLASQEPRSPEELKYLFENFILEERKVCDEEKVWYQFKLKPKEDC